MEDNMAALVEQGIGALLGLHEGFRSSLDGFVEDLAAGRVIQPTWDGFVVGLHDHHRHEDDEIYPQVRRTLGAEAAATFDAMDREHAVLAGALDRADACIRGDDPLAAFDAAFTLRAVLREHLAHEEAAAIPFIRRALDDEFMVGFFARRQAEASGAAGVSH
jgi:hemerythrin-like domain-containing protein